MPPPTCLGRVSSPLLGVCFLAFIQGMRLRIHLGHESSRWFGASILAFVQGMPPRTCSRCASSRWLRVCILALIWGDGTPTWDELPVPLVCGVRSRSRLGLASSHSFGACVLCDTLDYLYDYAYQRAPSRTFFRVLRTTFNSNEGSSRISYMDEILTYPFAVFG